MGAGALLEAGRLVQPSSYVLADCHAGNAGLANRTIPPEPRSAQHAMQCNETPVDTHAALLAHPLG